MATVFQNLEKATSQAADLAQKLTTFSNGGWLMKEKIAVSQFMKTTIDYLPEHLRRDYDLSIPSKSIFFNADERQLRQALQCLLINAAEADDQHRSITIHVQSYPMDDSKNIFSLSKGNYVKISIKDKGTGIAKEQIEKIFDPYFTTKKTYDRKGLGLGLAISYSIIKKHNGHINIVSEQGKGTVVTVFIPEYTDDAGYNLKRV
ncbi:MAG: HAMP domain-containing histidine kinase [bacterium]|nr:HAMP domain-containing histidine kinase [bacterium]